MKNEESNLVKHARSEFRAAGWVDGDGKFNDEMQEQLCNGVMHLLGIFAEQGHTGTTAPYALHLFEKLANFKPISPLTGEDWEWNEIGDGVFQNNRYPCVFKQADRFDGQAYNTEGVIFYDWVDDGEGGTEKSYFTSGDSCVPIEFPYTPTTEYRPRPTQ